MFFYKKHKFMLFQGWKISCNSTFSLVSYDSTGSNSLIGDLRLSSYWVISEGFYRKHPYITSLRQITQMFWGAQTMFSWWKLLKDELTTMKHRLVGLEMTLTICKIKIWSSFFCILDSVKQRVPWNHCCLCVFHSFSWSVQHIPQELLISFLLLLIRAID